MNNAMVVCNTVTSSLKKGARMSNISRLFKDWLIAVIVTGIFWAIMLIIPFVLIEDSTTTGTELIFAWFMLSLFGGSLLAIVSKEKDPILEAIRTDIGIDFRNFITDTPHEELGHWQENIS